MFIQITSVYDIQTHRRLCSTHLTPVDSPTYLIDNLEMFYLMNSVVDLHSYGVLEQIQSCYPNGNLGRFFFNSHKSNMDSGRHLDNLTFESVSPERCVIPLF